MARGPSLICEPCLGKLRIPELHDDGVQNFTPRFSGRGDAHAPDT